MITLPGLIDPHTHPRGLPTDDYKEDFYTCTSAALAGGFTTIIDMPNNPNHPTITYQRMIEKQTIAQNKIVCDISFFFGTNGKNLEEFKKAEKISKGLKVFLNQSTGNLQVDLKTFQNICNAWTKQLPILLHTEENTIEQAIDIATQTQHTIHICHVSSKIELQKIINAKEKGIAITCGVTPHHLFLSEDDIDHLKPYHTVKPNLKTPEDREFLWKNLEKIDVIESDHAPHTLQEKKSENPPPGFPGLETTLPLLMTAVKDKKITQEQIVKMCFENPAKIFNIQTDPSTKIELDEKETWTIKNENLFTKCKWSPFNGWKVQGKIKRVFIRGTKVFESGQILTNPGFGRII